MKKVKMNDKPIGFNTNNTYPILCNNLIKVRKNKAVDEGYIEIPCNNDIFQQLYRIAHTPSVGSPTGREVNHLIQVYICARCGREYNQEMKDYNIKGGKKNEQKDDTPDKVTPEGGVTTG